MIVVLPILAQLKFKFALWESLPTHLQGIGNDLVKTGITTDVVFGSQMDSLPITSLPAAFICLL